MEEKVTLEKNEILENIVSLEKDEN